MNGNTFVCDVVRLLWRNGRLGTAVRNVNGRSRLNVGQATPGRMFVLSVVTSSRNQNGSGLHGTVRQLASKPHTENENGVLHDVVTPNRGST